MATLDLNSAMAICVIELCEGDLTYHKKIFSVASVNLRTAHRFLKFKVLKASQSSSFRVCSSARIRVGAVIDDFLLKISDGF